MLVLMTYDKGTKSWHNQSHFTTQTWRAICNPENQCLGGFQSIQTMFAKMCFALNVFLMWMAAYRLIVWCWIATHLVEILQCDNPQLCPTYTGVEVFAGRRVSSIGIILHWHTFMSSSHSNTFDKMKFFIVYVVYSQICFSKYVKWISL